MTRFFPKSLARTGIITVLSASLALSPIAATPAKAGNDDAAAFAAASFFALLTAGIIASANQHGDRRVVITPPNTRPSRGDRERPRVNRRKVLPARCELVVHRGPDRGTYYRRACLKRNFDYWQSLPKRCEERVWVPRRDRNVNAYDAQCLSRFGYRERGDGQRTSRR